MLVLKVLQILMRFKADVESSRLLCQCITFTIIELLDIISQYIENLRERHI